MGSFTRFGTVLVTTLVLLLGCPEGEDDDDSGAVGDDDSGGETDDDDATSADDDDDDDTTPAADVTGTLWSPTLEWSHDNPTWEGVPFDLVARVHFVHENSGEALITEMFYAGEDAWNFRFTGTRPGLWRWTSSSDDPDLDGLSGTVWMEDNPGVNGFVEHRDRTWVWGGTERAFVPQLVMLPGPDYFHGDWAWVDEVVQTYIVEHGFSGFHVPVFCRWSDLDHDECDDVAGPEPDGRTFEALEILIRATHAAGGMVHLWAWGDDQHDMTPSEWGINGAEDQRIQRYIASRLGPLPGWTMGYGFDLDEWTTEHMLATWHANFHDRSGWAHLLGGRSAGPNEGTDHAAQQLYEGLDYAGYEHHQPDYEVYAAAIDARPDRPAFSEDRFRVRGSHDKDYTEEMTRRGLYHSTLAGGVANIWGYLLEDGIGGDPDQGFSHEYPHPEWIKTNASFFADRYAVDLMRCNEITSGLCLRDINSSRILIYAEDAASVDLDLTAMHGSAPAIAVDTTLAYAEVDIGPLPADAQTWTAPYPSDWALAIGTF
jgi:hypothetical protein